MENGRLVLHGDAYFTPDTMSIYRLFAKGSHNERKKKDKWAGINQYSKFIVGYRELDKVTGYQYHDDLVENIRWCLGFILERALLLSYKECYDVLEKYYNHSPELEGMPQSHMLQRKQKLPFWLFFYLEKLRQWKNRK